MPPVQFFLCMILAYQGMIIHQQGGTYASTGRIMFYLWSIMALLVVAHTPN
jgi:hypothetical protein